MRITGNVTGKMIAVAILKVHAATQGQSEKKQAVGLGRFLRYLGQNGARQDSWNRASPNVSPEVIMAQASLGEKWLERAGRLIARTTSRQMRCALLGDMIRPHLKTTALLYGTSVNVGIEIGKEVGAGVLKPALQPALPGVPLEMVEMGEGIAKIEDLAEGGEQPLVQEKFVEAFFLAREEVTNEQYSIYLAQTGVSAPSRWEDQRAWVSDPYGSVKKVGVLARRSFARWLGMRLLTEEEVAWVRQQKALPPRLVLGSGKGNLAFRVATSTG